MYQFSRSMYRELAEFVELFLVAGTKAFAQANQQQQRPHSPCDAKHGQKRTQFVRPQSAQGLAKNFQQETHRSP